MSESLKKKTVNAVLWSGLERFSVQGIQFVIMIIMARILTPSDYGLVGMLTIFLAVSQSLIDSGFSQALIRKQDRTEVDNSTVFYFNMVVGVLLYAILFVSAPFISEFYKSPELTPITRVIGVSLIINSSAVVQRALLTGRIDFKTQAKASFISSIASGIIGVWMAYSGYGVWSIVIQQIVNLGVSTFLLWIYSGWHPSLLFSWQSFRTLFSFGSKLLCSGLLGTIYNNLYLIVIGRQFSAKDLGNYTTSYQFAKFPSSNLTDIIQRVTYPVLCELQNDSVKLAIVYRRFLRMISFLIFPLMIGLAALSKSFILLILNPEWMFAATILPIICLGMMWYPVHAINLNLLQVKGRSDLFLKLEIWKKIIGVGILCVTIPFGVIAMCYGAVAASLIALVINTYYTGKLIKVGFISQMRDLTPILLYSFSMGVLVYGTTLLIESNSLQLFVGIIVGVIYYFVISYLFKADELKELLVIIKRKS